MNNCLLFAVLNFPKLSSPEISPLNYGWSARGDAWSYISWGLRSRYVARKKNNTLGFGEHGSVQNLGVDGIILKSGTPKSIIYGCV